MRFKAYGLSFRGKSAVFPLALGRAALNAPRFTFFKSKTVRDIPGPAGTRMDRRRAASSGRNNSVLLVKKLNSRIKRWTLPRRGKTSKINITQLFYLFFTEWHELSFYRGENGLAQLHTGPAAAPPTRSLCNANVRGYPV